MMIAFSSWLCEAETVEAVYQQQRQQAHSTVCGPAVEEIVQKGVVVHYVREQQRVKPARRSQAELWVPVPEARKQQARHDFAQGEQGRVLKRRFTAG